MHLKVCSFSVCNESHYKPHYRSIFTGKICIIYCECKVEKYKDLTYTSHFKTTSSTDTNLTQKKHVVNFVYHCLQRNRIFISLQSKVLWQMFLSPLPSRSPCHHHKKNYMTKWSDQSRFMNESLPVIHKFQGENNTICILYEATEIKATGNKLQVGVTGTTHTGSKEFLQRRAGFKAVHM